MKLFERRDRRIFSAVLAIVALFCFVCPVMAEEGSTGEAAAAETPEATVEQPAVATAETEDGSLREEINIIANDVKQKKEELAAINSEVERYRKTVESKKLESQSLEDQVALIDNRIAKEQLSIDIARQEIRAIELEIGVLDGRIAAQEAKMAGERRMLGALSRKLFRERFGRTPFEIVAAHRTLSEYFDTIHSLSRLQTAVDRTLKQVQADKAELAAQRSEREARSQEAEENKRQLEAAKLELEDEKNLKNDLLAETRSSELEYRYLLAELRHEQSEADSEIIYLEKMLRQKVDLADRLASQETVLSWPLVPTRGLSAVFHDPDYPFRYIFEHSAIDIRAAQGTAVRASAAGIVARSKNAGMGYSYVMLIHNNDIATVYGHLSRILAREDTFVERGEIVGYSGGMPGTPGAGRLTTGPHLHFEVRLGGIPVDPMNYLMAM